MVKLDSIYESTRDEGPYTTASFSVGPLESSMHITSKRGISASLFLSLMDKHMENWIDWDEDFFIHSATASPWN